MINFWNNNGYLVIENFNTDKECDELMERSSYLIEHNNFNNQKSIFDTVNQAHNDDNYFLIFLFDNLKSDKFLPIIICDAI